MKLLPKFKGLKIEQVPKVRGLNTQHLYRVKTGGKLNKDFFCGRCSKCKNNKPCDGLPSVTHFSGQYGGGGLYPGGYNAALDAVFGKYTDKTKTGLETDSWMSDFLDGNEPAPQSLDSEDEPEAPVHDFLRYRQEVESIPTPGAIARDFGSGVHATLESLLKAHADGCDCKDDKYHHPEVSQRYATAVDGILEWLNRGGADGPYVVEEVEVEVVHPTLLYGGQIDCVARCGNRVIVIDWKSGREIYPNHAMQIAAYAMAYEELTGEAVSECWIVKSGPSGFEAKQVANVETAQHAFIAIQEAKRNVDQIPWAKEVK